MPLWGPLKAVIIIGPLSPPKGKVLKYMGVQMLASNIKTCQFTAEGTHLAKVISKNISFDRKVFFFSILLFLVSKTYEVS